MSDLIGLNQDTLRLNEACVKEGDVAPLEANLLRIEISRAAVSRSSAQGRLVSAELEVRRLVGLDQRVPIPDSDIPTATPIDLVTLKREEAEAKPDITLSAGYTKQNSQFDELFGFNSSGALSPIRDSMDILNFGVSIPLRASRSGAGSNLGSAIAARVPGKTRPTGVSEAMVNGLVPI